MSVKRPSITGRPPGRNTVEQQVGTFQHHDSLFFQFLSHKILAACLTLSSSFSPISNEVLGVLPSQLSWLHPSLSITIGSSLTSSTLDDLCMPPVSSSSFWAAPFFNSFCTPQPGSFYKILSCHVIPLINTKEWFPTASHNKMKFLFLAFGAILLFLSFQFHILLLKQLFG